MAVRRTVSIDAEVASVGQFDRTDTFKGVFEVSRDGARVRIGSPTQSGFESFTVDWDDLVEAVDALGDEEKTQMQDAELHTTDGRVKRVELPAFPNNPALVAVRGNALTGEDNYMHYFVAGVIGLGLDAMTYQEVNLYPL